VLFDVVILAAALWASATATRVVVADPAGVELEVHALAPSSAGFRLVVRRDMPSAGWGLRVDAIAVDPEARRIDVRLTEIPPEGMAATVITPVEARAELAPLAVGRWFVEIRSRERDGGPYRPVHAAVLTAAP